MEHEFSLVFDTELPEYKKLMDLYERNEKFPKKIVSNRNLHHKWARSFSKKFNEPVDNDKDNLISLTPSDHFLAHYYMYKCALKGFRQPMATAYNLMSRKMLKYADTEVIERLAECAAKEKK